MGLKWKRGLESHQNLISEAVFNIGGYQGGWNCQNSTIKSTEHDYNAFLINKYPIVRKKTITKQDNNGSTNHRTTMKKTKRIFLKGPVIIIVNMGLFVHPRKNKKFF